MVKNSVITGWQWWPMFVVISVFATSDRPPHILFIMVDDLGWDDVSFHGSDQIQTPNIDVLAYKSVILQQYYSEAICTPARTALLTGKYPMRLGMHGMPLFNAEDRGIPQEERLLPSYLKELGYSTHLVGKWHVGMSREEYLPMSRGYMSHYGLRGGVIDYYNYNKVEVWPDGRELFGLDLFDREVPQIKENRYIVDILTEKATEIIANHNTSVPLFLHVTHNAPHAGNTGSALQPPVGSGIGNRHIAHPDRRAYADIVSHLDSSIGKLVEALAKKNILDNTMIIFVSDNGSPTSGMYQNWGVNLPFRGQKYTPWEGGVRVPAFVWHSSFRPAVWDGLMHITDWLPTLVAAGGGKIKANIDGINQWDPIRKNLESLRKEVLLIIEDGPRNTYGAYRAGDYKIVVGNVTGVSNGYYGSEYLINKGPAPDYFSNLRSCTVAKKLSTIGLGLIREEIEETRRAATIRQLDTSKDSTPCVPSFARGCMFNIRKDPTETHDLWERANKIAILLTSRLRSLWSMERRRGPLALEIEGDPANFDYVWQPWIYEPEVDIFAGESINGSDINIRRINDKILADITDCDRLNGIQNLLCLMRSIFKNPSMF